MNELLQKHGCSNVFTIPEGLKELMADISREVLRDQPPDIFDYIANYLSVLLITREHGILAVKILDDLCDCRPSVSEHLFQLGLHRNEAALLSQVIKEEVEGFEPEEGKEKVKETQILKKILARATLDEEMAAHVCQVARNAYRDYWYRKKLMEKQLKINPNEPWEIAAQRTLDIYKKTRPSFDELNRATQKIQAAYRGYHVRRNLLRHLKPKKKKTPKLALLGPPTDKAGSREINLGPVINVRVAEEDTKKEFDAVTGKSLNLRYDPMKTITHVDTPGHDDLPETVQLGGAKKAKIATTTADGDDLRVDEPPSEIPLGAKPSKQQDEMEKHRSHFLEPEAEPPHAESKSANKPDSSLNKISFAGKAQETTIADLDKQHKSKDAIPSKVSVQSKEAIQSKGSVHAAAEVPEEQPPPDVPEELPPPDIPESFPDDTFEVPEDITDSAAEADDSAAEGVDSLAEGVDSAPMPSAPSSAAATDVETSGEEEGD